MVYDESLEDRIKQDVIARNFLENNPCLAKVDKSSTITFCKYYGEPYCDKICRYAEEMNIKLNKY